MLLLPTNWPIQYIKKREKPKRDAKENLHSQSKQPHKAADSLSQSQSLRWFLVRYQVLRGTGYAVLMSLATSFHWQLFTLTDRQTTWSLMLFAAHLGLNPTPLEHSTSRGCEQMRLHWTGQMLKRSTGGFVLSVCVCVCVCLKSLNLGKLMCQAKRVISVVKCKRFCKES